MNTKKNGGYLLLLFLGCAQLMVGCSIDTTQSNKVAQGEIYQNYFTSYSQDSRELRAHVTFRVGGPSGTTVELVSPSSVRFDDREMSKSSFLGTSYEFSEHQNDLIPVHEWRYVDNDSKTYKNVVRISPVEIVSPPVTINKSQSQTIQFSSANESGEEVTLRIETASPESSSASAYTSQQGATSVTITPEDMQRLKTGQASLYLTRKRYSGSLQEGTSKGGSITAEYHTAKVHVNVVNVE